MFSKLSTFLTLVSNLNYQTNPYKDTSFKKSTFAMLKKVPRVNDDLLFANGKTGTKHPPKNSNIGNFSSFLLRFDFVDWEKSKRAHNFHPITGNVKRGRDRLMNHTSCESFALALMIKYIQYNTIWTSAAAAWSEECIIHALTLHHDHIHDYDCTRSITHRYFSFFFLLIICNCTQYVQHWVMNHVSSFDKSSKKRDKKRTARD